MHFMYDVLVLPAHTADNHLEVPVKFGAGIITHATIIFPPGCARLIHSTFWDGSSQLLPSNADASYYENDQKLEADCYIPVYTGYNDFAILAWTDGTQYSHLVHWLFDVQSPAEPDLAQSVKDMNGTISSLVEVLKGFY